MPMMVHTTVGHGASEPYSALSSLLGMIGPPLAAGPTVGNAQDQPAGVIPKTDQRLVASPKKASPVRPVGTGAAIFADLATEHVCLNGNAGAADPGSMGHGATIRHRTGPALVCWRH